MGAVILAGGESRRMGGKNKAFLTLEGKPFLERIAGQLKGFDELLLSVRDGESYAKCDIPVVKDIFPGRGAIGGLYSALMSCKSDMLLAVSCDMPLFERGLAEYMLSYVCDGYDAFIVTDRSGRIHPLCGCYRKSARAVLESQISAGDLRLTNALERLRVKRIPLEHSAYPDETVCNINSPGEYNTLRRKIEGPPVIAVSGVKNSGKTTLLENIIPILTSQGIRPAIIKHDGHDFTPDAPGSDSDRLRRAGARSVAVYSGNRYMITEEQGGITTTELVRRLHGADLVLLEGGKHSGYSKIEIVRKGNSSVSVCEPSTLLALCTDSDLRVDGVQTVGLNDYAELCRVITRYLEGGGGLCPTASEEI